MHSVWSRRAFARLSKFHEIEEGAPNFLAETILQKVWIIWSSLLYFNFKSFLYQNSSSFIRFQYILLDSGVRFSEFRNFYKLKKEDLISKLFGSLFLISILKVLYTQFLRHSLDFNRFCMIQEYFLEFGNSTN